MTNLFAPPSIFDLPLSLGKDLIVDFQRQVTSGTPPVGTLTNYDDGTVVSLIIDTDPQIVGVATITDYHAVIKILSATTDLIIKRTIWRCLVTLPDGSDLVPCNGLTIRWDGKVPQA